MAAKLVNNVKIAILNTGTGALQLGSAIEGYRGVEALTNGEIYSYSIRQNAAFEYGRGTYLSSGRQFLRQPTGSSDGGTAISLASGAEVAFTPLAEDLNAVNLTAAATLAAQQTQADAAQTAADRVRVETVANTGVGKVYETWSALSVITGAANDGAIVVGPDSGTHTDPVTGESSTPNTGTYRYSTSPAGWKRVSALTGTQVAVDAATASAAAVTATNAANSVAESAAVIASITAYDSVPTGKVPLSIGTTGFLADYTAVLYVATEDVVITSVGLPVYTLGSGQRGLRKGSISGSTYTHIGNITLANATATGLTGNILTVDGSGTALEISLSAGQCLSYYAPPGGATLSTDTVTGQSVRFFAGNLTSGTTSLTTSTSARFATYVGIKTPRAEIGSDDLSTELDARIGNRTGAITPTEWDMFLIAGESIAQGYNSPALTNTLAIPSGWAKQYYGSSLTDITGDPVGNSTGASMWPAFAIEYTKRTGRGVIFVPYGKGGSTLVAAADLSGAGNWSSTGAWRGNSITALNAAKAAASSAGLAWRFAGVLWAQGANDAHALNQSSPPIVIGDYDAAQPVLLSYFQTNTGGGSKMPFIMARTGWEATGDSPGYAAIRASQEAFARANEHVFMGSISAITFDDRGLLADNIHPTVAGWNEMGTSMAVVAATVCAGTV